MTPRVLPSGFVLASKLKFSVILSLNGFGRLKILSIMYFSLYQNKKDVIFPFIDPSIVLLQPVESSYNGSIVKTSEFKSFSVAESLKGFKASDFSITSLNSVGALSKLRTAYMPYSNSLNLADSMHTTISAFDHVEK